MVPTVIVWQEVYVIVTSVFRMGTLLLAIFVGDILKTLVTIT